MLTVSTPTIGGPWTAAYVDDFDTLNAAVWTNARFWGNRNTTFSGVFTPDNANVANGTLNLTAERRDTVGTDGQTYPVASGRVQTGGVQGVSAPGFAFQYGYVDVRLKGNTGNGLWSSAWMLPVSHQDGYEIDLAEDRGVDPYNVSSGYHEWRDGNGAWDGTPVAFAQNAGYHDYAVDWEPGSLRFYIDGALVRSYDGADVPSQPMYLILNLDVGDYAGDPTAAPALDTMSVDSVGVWQHTPNYFLQGQGVGALANAPAGRFADPSFEMVQVHGDSGPSAINRPSHPYWTFNDRSGLEANGSALGAPDAPNGTQAAFIQGFPGDTLGMITQTVTVSQAGTYTISFQGAKRATYGTEPIAVSVDGTTIGTSTPTATAYTAFTTPSFNLTAGTHRIAFAATANTTDSMTFLDDVVLNSVALSVPAPGAPVGLSASATSATTVSLAWTSGSGVVNSLLVQVSTDGSTFNTAATLAAGSTVYQATGLKPATAYTFRVVAQNGGGSSPPSNPAQATTASAVVPFSDVGFEQVSLGSGKYAYRPSGSPWVFTGSAGLEANGSAFGASSAPQGSQAAFLQGTPGGAFGKVSQALNLAQAGNYTISFQAARRANYGTEPIAVSVDGTTIATLTPGSTAFATLTTPSFTLTAGTHTIAFAATTGATDSASFLDAVALNPVATSLWMSGDVGAPAVAGSTVVGADPSALVLKGSGLGIRGKSDQFQYADRMTSGDTTVSARLASQSATDPWAKAGVMIRATSDAGSAYVAVTQTVGNGLSFEWRTANGASQQYVENLPIVKGPLYLKLVRSGNTFTGYYSTDGQTYSRLGSVALTMASNTFSGMVATSHDGSSTNTAVFDHAKITSS